MFVHLPFCLPFRCCRCAAAVALLPLRCCLCAAACCVLHVFVVSDSGTLHFFFSFLFSFLVRFVVSSSRFSAYVNTHLKWEDCLGNKLKLGKAGKEAFRFIEKVEAEDDRINVSMFCFFPVTSSYFFFIFFCLPVTYIFFLVSPSRFSLSSINVFFTLSHLLRYWLLLLSKTRSRICNVPALFVTSCVYFSCFLL